MNRNKEAVEHIFIAVVITLILSTIAYFIGTKFLAKSILDDAQAIGIIKNPQIPLWDHYWGWLVIFMGGVVGGILILWTVLSHWVLDMSSSKRGIWLAFFVVAAVSCAVVPYWYEANYTKFVTDTRITILFFFTHCILLYWGGSILTTSAKHKHTPFLSVHVR